MTSSFEFSAPEDWQVADMLESIHTPCAVTHQVFVVARFIGLVGRV